MAKDGPGHQRGATNAAKLTKRFVDGLGADPAGRDVTHWDDAVAGFVVRVKPSGLKLWVIQYRNAHGRQRKFTLGRVGVVTPDQARTRAKRLLADIEAGADPAEDKKKAHNAATVAELCEQYLSAGKGRIKASTLAVDRSRINCHVIPLLRSRSIGSITRSDIEKFMRDVETGKTARTVTGKRKRGDHPTGGRSVASRTVGMLGTIFERAVRDSAIPANPVRGVRRPKDTARKPPFSFEAVERLGSAMREASAARENPIGLRAIQLLLLTGCRRMEILTLKRSAVDQIARCFRLADTKAGPQTRPVGKAALQLVKSALARESLEGSPPNTKSLAASPSARARAARAAAIIEKNSAYVFPSQSKPGHFVGLPRVWARVAKRANIEDISIHGLRHWFASAAAEMNFSELTIAGLLGHRVAGVTARYATAPDAALLSAADRVSARLQAALDGKIPTDNVVPIDREMERNVAAG